MPGMRDANRIEPILEQIREVWKHQPDLRLGQLLVGLARPASPCPELFHLEDNELAHRLADYKNKIEQAQTKLRYLKQESGESRRDRQDRFGQLTSYFEIDAVNNVIRQIDVFDNGPTVGYDRKYKSDEFGRLRNTPLEISDEEFVPVTVETFNEHWSACSNRK